MLLNEEQCMKFDQFLKKYSELEKIHPLKKESLKTLLRENNVNVHIDHPFGWPVIEALIKEQCVVTISQPSPDTLRYVIT